MDPVIWITFISMLPFIELRGGIPYGILQAGLDPITVYVIAVLANILIIPVIWIFLDVFFKHLIFKLPRTGNLIHKTMDRAHRKAGKYIDKYGPIGLALFVAIPLPVTGAYTGCLVAYLVEMKKRDAIISVAVGVMIAGLLVTLAVSGALTVFNWAIGLP